jgi:carbohydrate kinase (thermoresistant glucokinase family)
VTAVVVMGVAGSGKSTVGRALAVRLGAVFVEGDDLHSPQAVATMAAGRPLSEADRDPWLARVRAEIVAHSDRDVVVACSALTAHARRLLADGAGDVRFVWLTGDAELLAGRLRRRRGHPVGPELLPSQLATLEPPADALALDVAEPPDVLVERIVDWLG